MRIAIVGTGAMGLRVAEELLASSAEVELLAIDASRESVLKFEEELANGRVDVAVEDANEIERLAASLRGSNIVVNSAQYDVNVPVMNAALCSGQPTPDTLLRMFS